MAFHLPTKSLHLARKGLCAKKKKGSIESLVKEAGGCPQKNQDREQRSEGLEKRGETRRSRIHFNKYLEYFFFFELSVG